MDVRIKRVDKNIPLPRYETEGSVCFDLCARERTVIKGQELGVVPSNTIIATPPGFKLLIALRSSTPKRFGLLAPHGIGIIDQDYAGEEDEVLIQVFNFRKDDVVVERGERIAQATFVPISRVVWKEQDRMCEKSRGGLGSTN
ncbi:dUTPase [Candidatus Woesearchaeota archaeon]|nr:dUTPase [Candidatus Woesearchaeota archaeon]